MSDEDSLQELIDATKSARDEAIEIDSKCNGEHYYHWLYRIMQDLKFLTKEDRERVIKECKLEIEI